MEGLLLETQDIGEGITKLVMTIPVKLSERLLALNVNLLDLIQDVEEIKQLYAGLWIEAEDLEKKLDQKEKELELEKEE